MTLSLLAALLPLVLVPFLVRLIRPARWATSALDAFVVVSIGGLVLLQILPKGFEDGGWAAVAAAFVGFVAPIWAERSFRSDKDLSKPLLLFAMLALVVHEAFDGLAIASSDHDHAGHADAIVTAVILHRLPATIGIWWFTRTRVGLRAAIGVLVLMFVATMFGFFGGQIMVHGSTAQAIAIFQSLFAGSLLHVVLGHSHGEVEHEHENGHGHGHHRRRKWQVASAVGGLLAIALLAGMDLMHAHEESPLHGVGSSFVSLTLRSAPALVLSYLIVGLAWSFLPAFTARKLEGGAALSQAARGVGLGVPTTICSCGVIPLQQRSIVANAPPAAAVAFLISSSSLGLAAILLSFQLLGYQLTLARIAAAVLLALLAGMWSGRLASRVRATRVESLAPPPVEHRSLRERLRYGFGFSLGETVDHTAPWFLMGLAIAAFIQTFGRPEWIAMLPDGGDVIVLALLGVPMYVCASGATPLAAVLLLLGTSPGAALAFLLTGPSTTLAMFGIPTQVYGRRVVFLLGAFMVVLSIGIGFATNAIMPTQIVPAGLSAEPGIVEWVAAVLFAMILVLSLLRQGVRGFAQRVVLNPTSVRPTHVGAPGHVERRATLQDSF